MEGNQESHIKIKEHKMTRLVSHSWQCGGTYLKQSPQQNMGTTWASGPIGV